MPPKLTNKNVIKHKAGKIYHQLLLKFANKRTLKPIELKFYRKIVAGRKCCSFIHCIPIISSY